MKLQYGLTFFFSVLACLALSFFFGFSLTKRQSAELEQSLLKKTLKIHSFSYLEQLNQKWEFLTKEVQQIQRQKKILSDSPFFALVVTHKSKTEQDVYFTENQLGEWLLSNQKLGLEKSKVLKSDFKKRKPIKLDSKKRKPVKLDLEKRKALKLDLEKRKRLIEFSQKAISQVGSSGFYFQNLKRAGENQALILFVKPLGKGRQGVAFFKRKKKFFRLISSSKTKNKEVFVIDRQGRLFFHNESSQIFKILSKKSPVWKTFGDLLRKTSRSRYLTPTKKAEEDKLYYLYKWKQTGMLLVTQSDFVFNFFSDKNFYFYILALGLLLFVLFFGFFCFRFFSFVSVYNFLKRAFLSFDKTGLFPALDSSHSLLYFYNNRQFFLNKRKKENQEEQRESESLNFQEIVKQEVEKLKLKYPRLQVEEQFNFDVKVFGFERFLRTIVYELLLNALEAMGGLKDLKLLLSIQKEEDDILFSVRDYGVGVQKESYDKLFQLYYSTKSRTGVGLNLVQSIVKSNKGNVELFSPEGGGLKVCVRLPLKCFLKNFF